jgi:SAM-dependent methyltransferase
MANLLLHSVAEFRDIFDQIFRSLRPARVLEIGAEAGTGTRMISELLDLHSDDTPRLHVVVDPDPSPELTDFVKSKAETELHACRSLQYLDTLRWTDGGFDLVVIDGDHNYFTVLHELEALARLPKQNKIVLLHDVGWPCGRRDLYYDIGTIPVEWIQPTGPHESLGVTLDNPGLIHGGFRGEGSFRFAAHEGGPRNGVLTAVEDFCQLHPDFGFRTIPQVFGLAAVYRRIGVGGVWNSDESVLLARLFRPYDTLMAERLERNRLELYLEVIRLQDRFERIW